MRTFILSLSIFLSTCLNAQIIEIKNFGEIEKHVTPDTLLLLDIDDTLLIPAQMLGCDEWFQCRWQHYQNEGFSKSDSLEKSLAEWEAIRHLTKMEIVESGTEEIVAKLQDQKFTVMGLTTQGLALATRTEQQLNENAIDLTLTAPSDHDHYLTVNEHGVLFRNGVLFTSGTHKGKALFGLFKQLGYTPKRIVFINDKATHLQAVEVIAEEQGVEFIGLRYAYSDTRKAAFSREVANYQFLHSTFTQLLSDAQARKALVLIKH